MTENSNGKGPLRYRLYFWLMDVCLFFAAVALFEFLLHRIAGIPFFGLSQELGLALSIPILFFNFMVPMALILARPLRDEYAELLWRRSVIVLAYAFSVSPFLIMLITLFIHPPGSDYPSDGLFAPLFERPLAIQVLGKAWMTYLLLFVGVFEFLRWRDSR